MRIPLLILVSLACRADESSKLLTVDHYVSVRSAVPAIAGQTTQLYVREIVQAGTALRATNADRIVLFVHGAGTPSSVAYDIRHADYSWMRYLANAGFDVFAMDLTGYGGSTRPYPMNDLCNLTAELKKVLHPMAVNCEATYGSQLTTMGSDWHDMDAVVDHLRMLRRVEKVTLFGWSLGGPRAGGYTSQHPEKVQRLVLLSPAYGRAASASPPAKLPAPGSPMEIRSQATFMENWDRQVGCPGQIDPAVSQAVWNQMQASDPQGATWGPGVRRAPLVTNYGWNQAAAAKVQVPVLLVAPALDKQVVPATVKSLFEDLASKQKVLVDLGCSSHNALWEKNHLLLFNASLEWLTKGSVEGKQEGVVRLGY